MLLLEYKITCTHSKDNFPYSRRSDFYVHILHLRLFIFNSFLVRRAATNNAAQPVNKILDTNNNSCFNITIMGSSFLYKSSGRFLSLLLLLLNPVHSSSLWRGNQQIWHQDHRMLGERIAQQNKEERLPVTYSTLMNSSSVADRTIGSDGIGKRSIGVGEVVAVVLVPVFLITLLWLVIVTDMHRKIELRAVPAQAERIRRATASLRGSNVGPNEDVDVENPLRGLSETRT